MTSYCLWKKKTPFQKLPHLYHDSAMSPWLMCSGISVNNETKISSLNLTWDWVIGKCISCRTNRTLSIQTMRCFLINLYGLFFSNQQFIYVLITMAPFTHNLCALHCNYKTRVVAVKCFYSYKQYVFTSVLLCCSFLLLFCEIHIII